MDPGQELSVTGSPFSVVSIGKPLCYLWLEIHVVIGCGFFVQAFRGLAKVNK